LKPLQLHPAFTLSELVINIDKKTKGVADSFAAVGFGDSVRALQGS
jgi:hypothetical protein